jgi:hypothetical protein
MSKSNSSIEDPVFKVESGFQGGFLLSVDIKNDLTLVVNCSETGLMNLSNQLHQTLKSVTKPPLFADRDEQFPTTGIGTD